jgi:peptide/nickel transport system permease protein
VTDRALEEAAWEKGTDRSVLTQWQLIRLRFVQHRVAVFSLGVLVVLYLTAILAEFMAPVSMAQRNLQFAYAPPQLPKFSLSRGIHVHPVIRQIDPITLQRTYYEDRDAIIPLGFLVRGEPYRLWGLIPMERRFFGIDRNRLGEVEAAASFFFMGADRYGRDILSRVILGSRISLSIGIVAIVITFLLGLTIGGVSGYFGGRVDLLIQRAIEIVNSFPQLPLWLALGAVMPPDWPGLRVYFAITIVLSLLGWTGLARVVRGKILSLREEDYAVAAQLLGASHGRILFRHLIPGFTSHIIVVLTMSVPAMILGETALSFLGLGLRPPIVSWGVMLQDCMNIQAVAKYPWLLMPVFPIILSVLCFNFLGDGLRDASDPYASR